MLDAADTIVVSLEGLTLHVVACTREESITLCANVLRRGDLLETKTFDDPAMAALVAADLEGSEFVGASRSDILKIVAAAIVTSADEIRDSGRDEPDTDADGDVLAYA